MINFLFLKILTKKARKITFYPKFQFFWAKNAKIFKNKKLIKKSEKTFPRYMYLGGFGKFLSKNIFLPLLKKKKLGQKITFLAISQKYAF